MSLQVTSRAPQSRTGTEFWTGSDGNIYYRATDGTTSNMGPASGTMTASNLTLNGSQQINDPLPGGVQDSGVLGSTDNRSTSTRTRTASTDPAPVLDQASVDATQSGIDSLATTQAVGRANIASGFDSTMGQYDFEAGRAKSDFDENTATNDSNFQKDKQGAMTSAAQGRRGLRATLASLGALGGDGAVLADRAVAASANEDLGAASETAQANTTQLNKAKTRFDEEDKIRRDRVSTERVNQETALEGSVLSKRQQGLQKLAELFRAGGQAGQADSFTAQAAELNNPIAQKTAVAATPFTRGSAAFTPGKLSEYLAGGGDMTVDVAAGGEGGDASTNATLLANRKKRERELLSLEA